eukprot:4025525-Amphidinium_carterae.1
MVAWLNVCSSLMLYGGAQCSVSAPCIEFKGTTRAGPRTDFNKYSFRSAVGTLWHIAVLAQDFLSPPTCAGDHETLMRGCISDL